MKFTENNFQEELLTEFTKREWSKCSLGDQLNGNAFSEEILEKYLRNKYSKIQDDEIKEIFSKIKNQLSLNWYENNKLGLLEFINEGILTSRSKELLKEPYKLIDFKSKNKNFLNVAKEVWTGSNSRQDLVLLINGLPIFNFELKSFSRIGIDTSVPTAIEQIKTYANDSPKFFTFNIASIAMNQLSNSFIGSPSSGRKFWFSLFKKKDLYFEKFFNFFTFSNIKNYFLFGILFGYSNAKNQKYILRHHQIEAILKIIPSIQKKQGGYVWHTQGSGKTVTIAGFLASLTLNKLTTSTTIIDVDRQSLARQMFKLLNSLDERHFSGTKIKLFKNSKELRNEISKSQYRGIYITTTQKFNQNIFLSNRDDILFISDEAHRTHFESKLENENKKTYLEKINTSLPNAIKLGFTGTPIFSGYFKTFEMFGDMLHKYTMKNAEDDGIITSIKYTYWKTKLFVDYKPIEELKHKKLNLKKGKIIDNSPDRINFLTNQIGKIFLNKTNDFLNYFPEVKNNDQFKAMFVCNSVESAYSFYNSLKSWFMKQGELGQKISNEIALVVSKRNTSKRNNAKLNKDINALGKTGEIIEDFKLANSKNKIVIVKDMLLTGYDVPNLRIMFFDRYIHSHNLLQAIARVNRNFERKSFGEIISFRDITKELKEALKTYRGTTNENSNIDISKNVELKIEDELTTLRKLGINLDTIEKQFAININKLAVQFENNQEIIEVLHRIRNLTPLVYEWKSQNTKKQAELARLLLISIKRSNYDKKVILLSDEDFQKILKSIKIDKKIIKLINRVDIKELLNENFSEKIISSELILQKISHEINSSPFLAKKDKQNLLQKLRKIISDYNNDKISKNDLIKEIQDITHIWSKLKKEKIHSKILAIFIATIKDQTIQMKIDTKIVSAADKIFNQKFSNKWWLTEKSKRERRSTVYKFLKTNSEINANVVEKITDIFLDKILKERIVSQDNLNERQI